MPIIVLEPYVDRLFRRMSSLIREFTPIFQLTK
jgi:hypothetical protein